MGVVLIGTFMVILDSTIVNVALPVIGTELGQVSQVEWVVTGYLLAVGVSQPATGWLADRYGRKRIFTASLIFFSLGSLLAALSPNLLMLVVFRVLQGLGGGAMMPVGMAMIYELFPPDRRGSALGIWGIAAMAAPAVGPVLGGFVVTAVSWRWLFLVNVPIGVLGVFAAVTWLRDLGYRERRPFDGLGLGLIGAGLLCLLIAFSQANSQGWTSVQTIALIATGSVLLVLFSLRELRIEHPLIELRMFRISAFTVTIAVVWLVSVMQFARLVFMPLELETLRGMSPLKVGFVLAPAALGTATTMPLGGRLADRIGARTPVMVGIAIIAGAAFFLGTLTPSTPIGLIVLFLFLQGLGTGLSVMPNTVAAMNSVPAKLVAQASAVRSLNRQIAGALGVAILSSLIVARIGSLSAADAAVSADEAQSAYNLIFIVALVALALAFVLSLKLPDREATRRAQEERSLEYYGAEEG